MQHGAGNLYTVYSSVKFHHKYWKKGEFFFLGVFLYKKKEFLLWNGIIILTFVCLRKPRVPWFQPMQLGLFLLFHFKTGQLCQSYQEQTTKHKQLFFFNILGSQNSTQFILVIYNHHLCPFIQNYFMVVLKVNTRVVNHIIIMYTLPRMITVLFVMFVY